MEYENIGYIYKIINLETNKVYIGQAVDPKRRWRFHQWAYQKYDNKLYRAMKKHGIENFNFVVIKCVPINQLNDLEIMLIESYNSYKEGYNATKGGHQDGARGIKHSQETIENMKKSHKIRWANRHQILRCRLTKYKHTHSEEARQKMSLAKKGKKGRCLSEEHKEKIRLANSGKKYKSPSKETIDKITAKTRKCVVQMLKDGTEIRQFASLKEAAESFGIASSAGLCTCLKGINKTYKGFRWKYVD